MRIHGRHADQKEIVALPSAPCNRRRCDRETAGLSACLDLRRTPHTPTEDDFRFFDVLAGQAADLIERTLVEEALREGEERFRLIANTAPVMIWMSGRNDEITYLNQTWLEYAGRPSDAAVESLRARSSPGRSGAMPRGLREGLRAA